MLTKKVKIFVGLIVCLVFFWVGRSTFLYLTYETPPKISFDGINHNGYSKGVVPCTLKCESDYKLSNVDAFLDGKRVDVQETKKISKASYEFLFDVDTLQLTDGKHSIEINAKDSSYRHNNISKKIDFTTDNVHLKSAFLQPEYKIDQGHTIHVKINSNKPLSKAQLQVFSKAYECHRESELSTVYECFIPVECEDVLGEHLLTAMLEDSPGNNLKLTSKVQIDSYKFPKQRGFTVSKAKLEEDREVGISDKVFEDALVKWLAKSPKQKLWSGKFEMPINLKRIATPFGEVRMTPEKGRYIHKAVDVIDHPQSVVWASQKGRVIIKDRYVEAGNAVVLDHGLGIFSMYFHLEDFADIEIGDLVKKGKPLGKLGKTGYATGYHLHWEIRVNNVAINPLQWIEKNF